MINLKTLLSVFNNQGTLLKWLQKLEAALNNSTLTDVQVITVDATHIKLSFVFADDTTIESDSIELPQGAPGKDGTDGAPGAAGRGVVTLASGTPTQENGYTVTPVTALYTDGTTPSSFNVSAKNGTDGAPGAPGAPGAAGKDGNGVIGITTIGYTEGTGQYAGYTETNLQLETDEEIIPFKAYAKNGASAGVNLYQHNIEIVHNKDQESALYIRCTLINTSPVQFNTNNFLTIFPTYTVACSGGLYASDISESDTDYKNVVGINRIEDNEGEPSELEVYFIGIEENMYDSIRYNYLFDVYDDVIPL